ncbi:iron-sulfur cluster assembly accessory protein [Coxiella endosymbiont of Amblyomma nuttalli]|uniref:iron-sulfur cluster assembly accessory protein n=1 Tax=Coxiella endosymbiont of Amblyomma nuttalli TaxID=2749996 RepID=UPI001BA9F013|nr:iron-sulfur cluster assembly accessory protein [Coxiella endosymbiont of Amblyomma nuttalli]QTS83855.1 Iron-binding protein IscA [Coxiella endosymbiont of Amblyomma nuttalli]
MEIPIIALTHAAYHHIQSLVKKRSGKPLFRVSVKKTGCSGYMYQSELIDSPKEGDVLVKTTTDLTILIDSHYVYMMRGTLIDYVKKDLGQYQLQFSNPNVVSTCGCGESFYLKEEKNVN